MSAAPIDPMLRGVINSGRRRKGWMTSADHYDPSKIKGAADRFWADRARTIDHESCISDADIDAAIRYGFGDATADAIAADDAARSTFNDADNQREEGK